jgi:hypothetical protein
MIPTKRVLTRKTKFRIGKDKDLTVQRMLDLGKTINLVSAYYKLTSIDYTKDILDEIGIVGDFVIEKPSTNKTLYLDFVMEHGLARGFNRASDKLRKRSRPMSKARMQSINHGN